MKVYIAQTRARGKAAQRVTVGEHGVITPEEARRRAGLILLRIKAGREPVPEPLAATLAGGPTVADLARHYLEDHVAVRCKAKTEADYRQAIAKHIAPALGRQPALAVDHARVTELHHALRDTPAMANRVVDTLSRIYNAAEDKGRIPEGSNPCRLVVRNREQKRERFLTPDELKRLGRVLEDADRGGQVSVYSVAARRTSTRASASPSRLVMARSEWLGSATAGGWLSAQTIAAAFRPRVLRTRTCRWTVAPEIVPWKSSSQVIGRGRLLRNGTVKTSVRWPRILDPAAAGILSVCLRSSGNRLPGLMSRGSAEREDRLAGPARATRRRNGHGKGAGMGKS